MALDIRKTSATTLVPDREMITARRIIGGFRHNLSGQNPMQSYAPRDPMILEHLGIQSGEKIFGFAGYLGDWLGQISCYGADVTYTDIDPFIAGWVRENRSSEFERPGIDLENRIRYGDPLIEPAGKKLYDWSFSYEPLPLVPTEWPIVLLRAMLNTSGLVVVSSLGNIDGMRQLKGFAGIYNLKGSCEIKEFHENDFNQTDDIQFRVLNIYSISKSRLSPSINPFEVLTVRTRDELRSWAEFDLSFISCVKTLKNISWDQLHAALIARGLAVDDSVLSESMDRVDRLSRLLPNDVVKTLKIE